MIALEKRWVGSEQRWCYGYGEGPKQAEFHICRERGRYIIYKMAELKYYWSAESSYGLQLWSYVPTLAKAREMISRHLEDKKAETVCV